MLARLFFCIIACITFAYSNEQVAKPVQAPLILKKSVDFKAPIVSGTFKVKELSKAKPYSSQDVRNILNLEPDDNNPHTLSIFNMNSGNYTLGFTNATFDATTGDGSIYIGPKDSHLYLKFTNLEVGKSYLFDFLVESATNQSYFIYTPFGYGSLTPQNNHVNFVMTPTKNSDNLIFFTGSDYAFKSVTITKLK